MNDSFQAREGMPPSLFPDGVPTYMGHYHKPHTVGNTNIRYVGSPYQGAKHVLQSFPSPFVHSLGRSPTLTPV
jgi:hypothetical protein